MRHSIKQRWQALTAGQPGRRFVNRYEAAREARRGGSWGHRLTRLLALVVALAAFAVGLILAFIPGPAIVFFLLAGSLLAAESRGLARLLDWGEVRLRALWKRGKHHWGQTPTWGRAALVTAVVCLSVTSTYISYRLVTH